MPILHFLYLESHFKLLLGSDACNHMKSWQFFGMNFSPAMRCRRWGSESGQKHQHGSRVRRNQEAKDRFQMWTEVGEQVMRELIRWEWQGGWEKKGSKHKETERKGAGERQEGEKKEGRLKMWTNCEKQLGPLSPTLENNMVSSRALFY